MSVRRHRFGIIIYCVLAFFYFLFFSLVRLKYITTVIVVYTRCITVRPNTQCHTRSRYTVDLTCCAYYLLYLLLTCAEVSLVIIVGVV